ncbi:MAG: endonuclease/exonuclease/phosphatase family protein [Gemmatimonadales bacterium]|nr:endonuclease/exonuclease/phosphatase family protein [Gemmatimonadales bacterium]
MPPAAPLATIRCPSRQHQVRLDPSRWWAPASCPVCKVPVDPFRLVRGVRWLGGRAPVGVVRAGPLALAPAELIGWLAFAGVVLVALLMRWWGDRNMVGTLLLWSGRWVWLLPLAALAPLGLVAWRALLPLALAAVVVVGWVMGASTGWRARLGAPEGLRVRVVSYNVAGGVAVAGTLRALVDELRPDILAIQECGPALVPVLKALPGYAIDTGDLCLATRFPVQASAIMPAEQYKGISYAAARRYTLATPAGPVAFTNIHLETPRRGLQVLLTGDLGAARVAVEKNLEFRSLQARQARRWVDSTTAPRLAAGDFNMPVESAIWRATWRGLSDAWDAAGTGFGYTKRDGWIRSRIDHVLFDARWRAVHAEVARDFGSDHRPMVADVVLVAAP